jgi:hypothetical protein
VTPRDKPRDGRGNGNPEDAIDVAPPADALWLDTPLDVVAEVPLFGLRLRFESNADIMHDLVGELIPPEQRTAATDPQASGGTTLRVRVVVEPTVTRHRTFEPTRWRLPDPDHALLRAAGVNGWVDLVRGEAIVYVEEFRLRAAVPDRADLMRGVMLSLATRFDRHPVHAAALRRGDAALLLCGPSGAGKSTLAYAASRNGISVLSDDAVRVQQAPEFRLWGSPGRVHLLDDARNAFSELVTRDHARVQANAGTKHVIPLPYDGKLFARRAQVCLIGRERGTVSRERATPEEIVQAILDAPESRSDMYPAGRRPAAEALAARGGWRLHLSHDVGDALPHVLAMLDEI